MHSQEYKKKVHYKNPSTWDINLRRIISINISLSSFQMSYVEQESGYLCFEIQEYQELDSQMPGRMRDWYDFTSCSAALILYSYYTYTGVYTTGIRFARRLLLTIVLPLTKIPTTMGKFFFLSDVYLRKFTSKQDR